MVKSQNISQETAPKMSKLFTERTPRLKRSFESLFGQGFGQQTLDTLEDSVRVLVRVYTLTGRIVVD